MSEGPGPQYAILGISCDYHDAAAALVVDGAIVAAAEEERFTRLKHDHSTPINATRACLELGGLAAADIDRIVFYEKPLAVIDRVLTTRRRQGPRSLRGFLNEAPTLATRNLMIAPRLAHMMRRLGARRPPSIEFVDHHRSHAGAAFYPSPFDHAAVVVADGLGEWATISIGHGTRHRLSILEEQRFPHSIGLMYSLITAWCGFTPLDDEYKVMGLAPYGVDRFADTLAELAGIDEDGSFRVSGPGVSWFAPSALRSRHLRHLFEGPPRSPADPITARDTDLAASVQALTERAVLAVAQRAQDATGERSLCLAGGVALNCVANGRLARSGLFDDVWVQPAAGDAGGAIGAALNLWHTTMGRQRVTNGRDAMSGAQLGPHVDDAPAVVAAAESRGLKTRSMGDDELESFVAERLADGAVVGWCQGRLEFGPRALGNRSILADPRSTTVREQVNAAVKGRESFRPFAPAVLADKCQEWFDLDTVSPYMLIVAPVRPDRHIEVASEPDDIDERARIPRSTIPACTHVDATARVQTIDEHSHPRFVGLVRAFDRLTGCPVVLNTSFNRAGQPIVNRTAEILDTALHARLDLVVIGNVVIEGMALDAADATSTWPIDGRAATAIEDPP